MQINTPKSSFYKANLSFEIEEELEIIFPYKFEDLNSGIKYLIYMLNPNYYSICNWYCLLKKVDFFFFCDVIDGSLWEGDSSC